MMAERECYVRAVYMPTAELECIAGLEHREGDDLERMYAEIYFAMRAGVCDLAGANDLVIAVAIERRICALWPDRAWFLEVGRDDRWIQIFVPFGLPRHA